MPFVDDDQLVEALVTDRTYPAFRVSIGIRSANWCVDHPDVLRRKDLIEGGGELGIPLMEEIPKGWRLVFRRPTKLTRLLGDPTGGWMFYTIRAVGTARAQFYEEEDINGFQPQGFYGEKITRQ